MSFWIFWGGGPSYLQIEKSKFHIWREFANNKPFQRNILWITDYRALSSEHNNNFFFLVQHEI
jgi:hypothetical protein